MLVNVSKEYFNILSISPVLCNQRSSCLESPKQPRFHSVSFSNSLISSHNILELCNHTDSAPPVFVIFVLSFVYSISAKFSDNYFASKALSSILGRTMKSSQHESASYSGCISLLLGCVQIVSSVKKRKDVNTYICEELPKLCSSLKLFRASISYLLGVIEREAKCILPFSKSAAKQTIQRNLCTEEERNARIGALNLSCSAILFTFSLIPSVDGSIYVGFNALFKQSSVSKHQKSTTRHVNVPTSISSMGTHLLHSGSEIDSSFDSSGFIESIKAPNSTIQDNIVISETIHSRPSMVDQIKKLKQTNSLQSILHQYDSLKSHGKGKISIPSIHHSPSEKEEIAGMKAMIPLVSTPSSSSSSSSSSYVSTPECGTESEESEYSSDVYSHSDDSREQCTGEIDLDSFIDHQEPSDQSSPQVSPLSSSKQSPSCPTPTYSLSSSSHPPTSIYSGSGVMKKKASSLDVMILSIPRLTQQAVSLEMLMSCIVTLSGAANNISCPCSVSLISVILEVARCAAEVYAALYLCLNAWEKTGKLYSLSSSPILNESEGTASSTRSPQGMDVSLLCKLPVISIKHICEGVNLVFRRFQASRHRSLLTHEEISTRIAHVEKVCDRAGSLGRFEPLKEIFETIPHKYHLK
ncbi:hypothetical protein ADUPG1_012811 [Aduncisulcus paluster]|uniref:Uncharacterized protein n=1 Tax=Aduncisulcus paluster TaxID=2918883 RepID=A0ABQ5K2K3_9EUKA|nr:hypothetical protein ADUPG1_012811 [Aduncisulcus paluster]